MRSMNGRKSILTAVGVVVFACFMAWLPAHRVASEGRKGSALEQEVEPVPFSQSLVKLAVESHPRLLWTAEELPALRAKSRDQTVTEQGISPAQLWQRVIKKAEEGDIFAMALAYALGEEVPQNEHSWADKLKEQAMRVCAQSDWGRWFDLARNTLTAAIVYDVLYDDLKDDERKTIRTALVEKGINPLLDETKISASNNYLIGCSALGLAALALIGEPDVPQAVEWATRARDIMRAIFELNGVDGGYGECSLGYGTVGFDNDGTGAVLFMDALKRACGDDSLLRHPYVKNLMYFAMYTMRPDGIGGVGFCDTWQGSGFHLTVLCVAAELRNGHGMWYLKKTNFLRNDYPGPTPVFLFYDPALKARSPEGELPLSKHFRGIGWVIFRSDWEDKDGILFAMQTETRGHYHEHNSMNHFEIHGYRSRLATSPGYHHGRAWRATYGHNLLWVDGKGQNNSMLGRPYCDIKEFVGSEFFDYTVGEAHPYGMPDDPWLEFWNRHVVFAKPDYFVVYDHVKASKGRARKFSWVLQVTIPHALAQKGEYVVEGDRVISRPVNDGRYGDTGQLFGKIILPTEFTTNVGMWEETAFKETYGPYYELVPKGKKVEEKFLVVLYPQPRDAVWRPEVKKIQAEGGVVFEVTVPDGRNLHIYRLGDAPVQGGGIETDGLIAMVSISQDGAITRYALCDGRELKFDGRTLLSSSQPIIAAFASWKQYRRDRARTPIKMLSSSEFYGVVKLKKPAYVTCTLPRIAVLLEANGKAVEGFTATQEGITKLRLEPGTHRLRFKLKGISRN